MSSRVSVLAAAATAAIAMIAGGCRSDAYYQDRAAERARKFLIEEAKELSAEEKYFITFNDPVFLISPIIGAKTYVKARSLNAPVLSDELNQICISWKLPEREEWYMVYGTSNGRMDFWYPDRLIRKKFSPAKVSMLENATAASRNYAKNNLFGLMNVAEQNFIRFHFPAVYETNFELNFDPEGKLGAEMIAAAKKQADSGIQYSLVWETPGSSEPAVFCGIGGYEMGGWSINFAGKTSVEELRAHTVNKIKDPEDFYAPFPARYVKQEVLPQAQMESK